MVERIVLTGMMCSGKTTVGKVISRILGWDFVDTDSLIEKQAGMNIPEIFIRFGEKTFRQLEKEAVKKVISLKKTVISTGGGVVLDKENIDLLSRDSIFVYLKASPDKLKSRCRSSKRPLLKERSLEEIYREREKLYESIPYSVNAEKPPFQVAQQVLYLMPPSDPVEIPGVEDVFYGRGLMKLLDEFVPDNAILFVQRKVARVLRDFLDKREVFLLPDGEKAKTLSTFERASSFLMERKVSRDSTIVSVGGGAASDLVGFLASVFKRGVKFINVPTTLLSQVDAGIGGKNALNFRGVKNVIGTFYHPEKVLIDPLTLLSLDNRSYIQGFAEIVKMAIISGPQLFRFVEENTEPFKWRNMDALREVILSCVKLKLDVVQRDFTEKSGERKILNLGHTFGHAYEMVFNLYHGEAVALGLLSIMEFGQKLGITDPSLAHRVSRIFEDLGLIRMGTDFKDMEAITERILQDKKIRGGQIEFVIPVRPGEVRIQPFDLPVKI